MLVGGLGQCRGQPHVHVGHSLSVQFLGGDKLVANLVAVDLASEQLEARGLVAEGDELREGELDALDANPQLCVVGHVDAVGLTVAQMDDEGDRGLVAELADVGDYGIVHGTMVL